MHRLEAVGKVGASQTTKISLVSCKMPRVGGSVVSAPAPAAVGDTKEVSSPKRRRTTAGKDNLKTKSLQQVDAQEGVDAPAASPVSKRKKAKKDKEQKEPPKELPEPKPEPKPEEPPPDPFDEGLEAHLEGLDAVAEGAWFSSETFEDLLPERYRESLGSPHQDLIELVMSSHTWWRPGLRSLVKNLADLNQAPSAMLRCDMILPSPCVLLVPAGIRAGIGCDAVDQRQGARVCMEISEGSFRVSDSLKGETGLHKVLLGVHCERPLLSHLCRVVYNAYL
eukprot:s6985_g1.t1